MTSPDESNSLQPAESANSDGSQGHTDSNRITDKKPLANEHCPRRLSLGGMAAWFVVILLSSLLVGSIAIAQFSAASQIGGDATKTELIQVEIQSKVLIGQDNLSRFLPANGQELPEVKVPDELDAGCYEQRLVVVALKSELESHTDAQDYLQALDQRIAAMQAEEAAQEQPPESRFELTPDQQLMRDSMDELLSRYSQGNTDTADIPDDSKQLLKQRLGFPAELFLLPEGTAQQDQREALLQQSAVRILGMGVVVLAVLASGFLGFCLTIVLSVLVFQRQLVSRFFYSPTCHNVYIHTFALWMIIFFGGSIALGEIGLPARTAILIQPLIFFGSLICLAYPVMRGISFRQVRSDIGWTIDRPAGDIFQSVVSYLATLPCLIPGFIFVIIGSTLFTLFTDSHEFARQVAPSHPIQEFLAVGDWIVLSVVFISACIAAPVVEETMFRGVLYRHLREWTGSWARWISVIFSALLNGFIFAAIHPQGLVTIPVLMTLAVCFSLAREWRNSLITPMLMHGIHNTVVTCVSLILL